MKLAVVGGGWAGLTAAVRLQRSGHHVVVYESAAFPGGRARRAPAPALGIETDNGQHILLGAYTATLDLMKDLGLDTDALFLRIPLTVESADGDFHLKAPKLPAPVNLLSGVLAARGIGVSERCLLIQAMIRLRLKGWQVPPGTTVQDWLTATRQSPRMIEHFWRPLCVAALNTPVDQACAQLFANVLRDSLGGRRDATDMLLPRVDLSALWPDRAAARLHSDPSARSSWRPSHTVRQLAAYDDFVDVDEEPYDAVILAANIPSTRTLLSQLPPLPGGAAYLDMLSSFSFLPIATVTLQLKSTWPSLEPMTLLREDPARLQYGQWLFNRPSYAEASSGSSKASSLLHVVVSDARALLKHDRHTAIESIIQQVREQTRRHGDMPEVLRHHLIVEKRATFAAVPGLRRPPNATPWPRIWTAGDWTDTGYPAVLEGAVRSGNRAAEELDRVWGQTPHGV